MLSGNCTEALSIQANVAISGSSARLIKNGIALLPFPTAVELSTAAGRHRSSPSPREARTGRGLGRGVSELGQKPSSPRPSPPLLGGEGDVGPSRRGLNSMAVSPCPLPAPVQQGWCNARGEG